jgi:uncharacterized protein DUF2793
MSSVTDPNLGLNYGWALSEDGWNTGADQNWKKLGGLAFLSVINRTTDSQPGSPSNGDRYIIPADADWGSENQVAVRVAGVWEFYTPQEGWRCYDQTTGQYLVYTDADGWKQIIGVRVPSTGTGVFDVVFENTENLTANRTLTITVNNANRSIALGGNLTLAKNLTTTGSGNITFSAAADASVAVPATGTLATINGAETLTNKTLTAPTITGTVGGSPTITSPTLTGTPLIRKARRVLIASFGQASTSGTGTNTIATYTVPANTLLANDDFIIGEAWGSTTGSDNTKNLAVSVAGTGLGTGAIDINDSTPYRLAFVIGRRDSTHLYFHLTVLWSLVGVSAAEVVSSGGRGWLQYNQDNTITVTDSADSFVINVTGQCADADDHIIIKGFIAEVVNQ